MLNISSILSANFDCIYIDIGDKHIQDGTSLKKLLSPIGIGPLIQDGTSLKKPISPSEIDLSAKKIRLAGIIKLYIHTIIMIVSN